jgi:hypothetical protein
LGVDWFVFPVEPHSFRLQRMFPEHALQKAGIIAEMLYGLHEAAALVGLAPVTLQNYCSRGKSDLVRGEDFIVEPISPYRRLMITSAACGD